jgi:glycosyltransferase involved in cell wall biosynthesis
LPLTESGIRILHERCSFDAVILLGYPDQFPFLNCGRPFPFSVYLWSQFSSPPRPGSIGCAAAVPLTPISRNYIELSGHHLIEGVIPHGVDTRVFSPADEDAKARLRRNYSLKRQPVIGTVGINSVRKRFDVLIDTFARVRERIDCSLLIKTDRSNKAGGYDIPRLLQRYGQASSASVITEPLSAHDMAALLSCLDLYVHAAEWEGFGIPIIEALACAVPVLCCKGQGPGEIAEGGVFTITSCRSRKEGDTLLFDIDPKNFSEHILRSLAEADRLQAEAARGREQAVCRYDYRTVAGLWAELLREKTRRR